MVYKYYTAEVGRKLYEEYRLGIIRTEEKFKSELKRLMGAGRE